MNADSIPDERRPRRLEEEQGNVARARTAYPTHFELAEALQDLAAEALDNVRGGPGPGQVTPQEFAQRLLFMKAFKSFWSIVVLSERRLTDDAGIILRSLFNLWIVARWIRCDPLRAQRYREWFWIAARPIIEAAPERTKAHPDLLSGISEGEAFFREHGWKTGAGHEWHGSKIKDMAAEVGLSRHYEVVYRGLSSIEHSDVMAYLPAIKASGPRLAFSLWSDATMGDYLGLSFCYFAQIFEEWNTDALAVAALRIHDLGTQALELLRPEYRPDASRERPPNGAGEKGGS